MTFIDTILLYGLILIIFIIGLEIILRIAIYRSNRSFNRKVEIIILRNEKQMKLLEEIP